MWWVLVKMEKALQLGGRCDQTACSIDGNVRLQKPWSLYGDFSKGLPETSDTRAFTASEGQLHRLRSRFGLLPSHVITGIRRVSTESETTFLIIACYYSHSTLLWVTVVSLLLCLVYKLNITIGVYVQERHSTGLGTIRSFRPPLGVVDCVPCR